MKICITGGAGFIGSHIANALLKDGHNVHILDNFSTGKQENIPDQATVHTLDIGDALVLNLFSRERFDVLVHHAAQMDVRRSVMDPIFDATVNILGFLNLMEAGRQHGLKKIVFASTGGAIYGEPVYTPQDEKHALNPLSPYGITKLSTEKYLYFYQQQYGMPSVCLRYANVYGPRQNPHGEAGVIAIFSERLLTGRQPVVYGDGQQTRDYVYVGDVVQANRAAIAYDGSGVFNVGTGLETSVNTLFDNLRDLIDPSVKRVHEEGKPGEQKRSVLSIEKSKQELGWQPSVSLAQGLENTVHWFKEKTAR